MKKRNRSSLDISVRPETALIMKTVAVVYGAKVEDLTARRPLPYKTPAARARRVAMIALHKYYDNANAVSKLFKRHASTIWMVLNGATDDEHRYAGEIVSRVP